MVFDVADEGAGHPAGASGTGSSNASPAASAPAGGGTGLGLAIARWVVQLHGGTIAVVDPAGDRLPASGSACRSR